MLSRLSIKNYALIDNLDINFSPDLNILTGETGAGKSIILGAISLILGQRAESKYFFNQQKKCIIEGVFLIKNYQLNPLFENEDIDYDDETTLRREISLDGKSRAFINDTPVNLNTLKTIGEQLIDIHSQHATIEINNPIFQLMLVDASAGHPEELATFKKNFKTLKIYQSKLREINERNEKLKADADYFQFQFNELEQAKLEADELEILEEEIATLTHAEEIKKGLLNAIYLLTEQENSVLNQLNLTVNNLQNLEKYNSSISKLTERLKSSLIEIKDISDDLSLIESQTNINQEKLIALNERLNLIYHLLNKHRVSNIQDLIAIEEKLSEQLNSILHNDEETELLSKQIHQLHEELKAQAENISANRKKIIPKIESYIENMLSNVGMPETTFKIEVEEKPDFDQYGKDAIKFLFSANKGHQIKDLSKIASGGELSRLMLVIKSLIAKERALPAIIFDEIDTGISGEVANKVGTVMQNLAQNMQVIAITHLPQIAAKGKTHYFVFKDEQNNLTNTKIKKLNEQERITEIAKMISGENPSKFAFENAKELLS